MVGRERLLARALAAQAPLVVRGDVADDAEQPGAQGGFTAEAGQTAVHDDERVLGRVIEARLRHAQAAQAPPDEGKVAGIDVIERGHRVRALIRCVRLPLIVERQGVHGFW